MALDGAFLYLLQGELTQAVDARVEKIYQPSKDELVFLLRKVGFHKRLLCSVRQSAARVHFTETNPENPPVPPMFCMLLRKILGGAKITAVQVEPFERVLTLCFSATNEMGDKIAPRLVVELTGAKSNLLLLGDDGRIIDAARRSDLQTADRMVQPGATYTPPPRQHKFSPLCTPADQLLQLVCGCGSAWSEALVQVVDGISPLIAREWAFHAGAEDTLAAQLSPAQKDCLLQDLQDHCDMVGRRQYTPTLLCRNGAPADFCYRPITQYGNAVTCATADNLCQLLDDFYAGREAAHRLQTAANDIFKLVNNLLHRATRKNKARQADLAKCATKEQFRLFGELLKVNLHLVEKGATQVRVVNYYDPEAAEIAIPLNEALSPAANAAYYFKEYKKLATAEQLLKDLIADSAAEQHYLESVAEELSRAQSMAQIEEIRNELVQSGYIRLRHSQKQKKTPAGVPFKCQSVDGAEILIGRNNLQNDQLTLKTANREDLWFHTKEIHGAHVILKTDEVAPSDEAILQTAAYAAYYSKASASSQVPVDYTRVRYVKKPSGARPGMVIYTNQKTVYVTPKNPLD